MFENFKHNERFIPLLLNDISDPIESDVVIKVAVFDDVSNTNVLFGDMGFIVSEGKFCRLC